MGDALWMIGQVRITTTYGDQWKSALVSPCRIWAIHGETWRARNPWVLTHQPTGMKVANFPTTQNARRCGDLLRALVHMDWETATKQGVETNPETGKVHAIITGCAGDPGPMRNRLLPAACAG